MKHMLANLSAAGIDRQIKHEILQGYPHATKAERQMIFDAGKKPARRLTTSIMPVQFWPIMFLHFVPRITRRSTAPATTGLVLLITGRGLMGLGAVYNRSPHAPGVSAQKRNADLAAGSVHIIDHKSCMSALAEKVGDQFDSILPTQPNIRQLIEISGAQNSFDRIHASHGEDAEWIRCRQQFDVGEGSAGRRVRLWCFVVPEWIWPYRRVVFLKLCNCFGHWRLFRWLMISHTRLPPCPTTLPDPGVRIA
jgi:hypothetical protein